MTFSLHRFLTGVVVTSPSSACLFSVFLKCWSSSASPCHCSSTPRFHGPSPDLAHHLGTTKRNLSSLSSPWQWCQVAVHDLVTCCPPVWCHTEPRDCQAAIARLGVGNLMAICLDVIRFSPSLAPFKFTGSCFPMLHLTQTQVGGPSAVQELAVHRRGPILVDVDPHEAGGRVSWMMPGADVLLQPWALPGSCSVSTPWTAPNSTLTDRIPTGAPNSSQSC